MSVIASLLLAMQLYQPSPGRVVWVGKFPELGAEPFLLDYSSGRFVKATAEELAAVRDAKTIETRSENVFFRNGDVRLAGKITLPVSEGKHPTIVLIHGSNDEDRDFLDPWVGFFVSRGLAVLSYDKRGVRESAGDWKRADFGDLAGDAHAGVQLLRTRKDIDAKRIGLFGISQGGWIAPVVASRDTRIAFIILHAGSGLPVGENGLLYVDSLLRGYGFPEEEIEQAMAYYRLNDDVTRDPARFAELKASYDKARARKVEWLLEEPQAADFWFRRFYRGIMDFDPAPYWAKVRCPVLAFLGALDHNVPPEPNRKALENALKNDATIVVLPSANHLFLRAKTGLPEEYPALTNFVDGYFDVMGAWLAQHSATMKP
ncbi:MAG TPA: CocE/NonD family hydrolase [Thermoanaerobaculia bacterium]|nr:CocE/NonD family hydrolase [Thermoanaerobaculia bacterium]